MNRRQFLALGGAAFATAAGVPLYAWQIEPHWVDVVRRPLPLEDLRPALEGRTLLQLNTTDRAPGRPTIVLVHNPDVQDLPIWGGVRAWLLSGHTHGGQLKPPFLPPPILPVQQALCIRRISDRPGAHAVHQPRAGPSRASALQH